MIQELQETQDEEREAYKELEEAMVEASVGKRERLGQSLGGDTAKSNHLPGLTAAGSIGVNTSYNGFEIYGGGGYKTSKSGGRNGTHQSGKSMRVSN